MSLIFSIFRRQLGSTPQSCADSRTCVDSDIEMVMSFALKEKKRKKKWSLNGSVSHKVAILQESVGNHKVFQEENT